MQNFRGVHIERSLTRHAIVCGYNSLWLCSRSLLSISETLASEMPMQRVLMPGC